MKQYLWAAIAAVIWAGGGEAKPVTPVLDGVLPFVGVRHVFPPEAALAYPPTLRRPYAAVLSDRIGVHRQWRYTPDLYGPLFEVQFDLSGLGLRSLPSGAVRPVVFANLLPVTGRSTRGLPAGRFAGSGAGLPGDDGGSAPERPIIAPVPLPAAGGLALAAILALGFGSARRRRG